MELLKQMKKANFNISLYNNGKTEAHQVSGYIFKYGALCFGVNRAEAVQGIKEKWVVTELQTGMRCGGVEKLKDITSDFMHFLEFKVLGLVDSLKWKYLKGENTSYFNFYYRVAQNTEQIEKLEKKPSINEYINNCYNNASKQLKKEIEKRKLSLADIRTIEAVLKDLGKGTRALCFSESIAKWFENCGFRIGSDGGVNFVICY